MSSRVTSTLVLNATEKKELLAVLGAVDQDTKDVFGLTLNEAQWTSVPGIVAAVAYQGFDPYRIIAEFMKKSKADPGKPAEKVTVGDVTIEVSSGTDAKTDLLFLLTLFITRGNNVSKILLKCDTGVRDVISRKCSQYGISTTAKAANVTLGPSVITLARLSQAFAPATASVILGHSIAGTLRSRLFPGVVLPLLMTHTIFPALIREEDKELISIAKYLNLEMSIMLSAPKDKRRMASMTMSDLLEQSETFVMAAVSGSITADSVKEKALIKAGILETDGNMSLTVSVMSRTCGMLIGYNGETYSHTCTQIAKVLSTVNPPN